MLLKMKKKLNWFICLTIGVFAFAACSDDEGGSGEGKGTVKNISVQVEKGSTFSSLIDSVFVESQFGEFWGEEIIARSAYKGGNFILNLPNELDDSLLEPMYYGDEEENGFIRYMTISDKSTKCFSFESLYAYSKKDGYVGYITRSNIDMNELMDVKDEDEFMSLLSKGIYLVVYMYVDRDVTISGSYTAKGEEMEDEYSMNLSLQKGWNVVATKMSMQINKAKKTATVEYTSSVPSGLKWHFYNYSYLYDDIQPLSALKSSSKSAPLFKKANIFKSVR